MRSPQGCSSPRTGGISFGLDSWHWSRSRITFAGPITIGNTKNSAPLLRCKRTQIIDQLHRACGLSIVL